jgi:Fe-S-cluster containining protein
MLPVLTPEVRQVALGYVGKPRWVFRLMAFSTEPTDSPELQWFESGLRFKCTGCGKCCTGSTGSVSLSAVDLERLANFFHLSVGRFVRTYTRVIKGRRALTNGSAGDCVFLKDRICTVYEARPTQCRTYPWWLSNIHDLESWQEAGQICEGINHPTAPIVSASEILEMQRMDLENESRIDWRRSGP